MLNTVAKRIQTRLSRQGLKVALGEIKNYLQTNVADVENITDIEVNATTEYFMSNATTLTVTTENVDPIHTSSIQHIDAGMNEDLAFENITTEPNQDYPEQSPKTGELTHTANQSQLITTTADQMGIILDASEISLIAENIQDSTNTLEQDIDAIRSAIIAFVNHKAMVNQSKINNMITEVREVVGRENQRNSRLLSDGLKNINNDIQEANKAFKSNVTKALSAFTIPAIKAG